MWIIVVVIVIFVVYWVMYWLYCCLIKEVVFVCMGFLGEKVVINGGVFVWLIIYDIILVNMNLM